MEGCTYHGHLQCHSHGFFVLAFFQDSPQCRANFVVYHISLFAIVVIVAAEDRSNVVSVVLLLVEIDKR